MIRFLPQSLLGLAILSTSLTGARLAGATDSSTRSTARSMGYEGVQAYQAGDYQKAEERLERAYKILEVPSLALWSARALEKQGKLVEASERYLDATRAKSESGGAEDVQKKAQEEALVERNALLPRIPHLTITVDGATDEEVIVRVNGVSLKAALIGAPRATNPGVQKVEVSRGEETQTQSVELKEGATEALTFHFESLPATVSAPPLATSPVDPGVSERSWQRPLAWSALSLGAGGLILGGITTAVALGKYGDLNCPGDVCTDPDDEAEVSSYQSLRTVSSVGFIAGGVLAAGGLTLLLTAPSKDESAWVSPYIAGAHAGLKGAF